MKIAGRLLTIAIAFHLRSGLAQAGLVNLELRPANQTVTVGDNVDIGVYAVSADGNSQQVGLVGAVIHFDATKLDLTTVVNNGPFVWQSSGFPDDPADLNNDFSDGDAYYQAVVPFGGGLATATPAGLLCATIRFTARNAATGPTQVSLASCDGTTCSTVLDRHPLSAGVLNITGSFGPAVNVNILCNTDPQCDDDNPCTDDECDVDDFCANIPNDANDPDDFLFCNGHEMACSNGSIVIEPGSVPDCDDELTCTTDTCNETLDVCDHALQSQRCLINGVCYNINAVNPGNECQECKPAISPTNWTNRAGGTACGNPNPGDCDNADSCNGLGVCSPNYLASGTPCGEPADTQCTNPDACNASGICLSNHAVNTTPCDDGQFCSVTDVCINGACLGSARCPGQVCDEFEDVCEAVVLEWRNVQPNPVVVNQEVKIGLFAVSDTGSSQPMSSVSAILTWDPTRLQLLGKIDEGPYAWQTSWFPDDSALDGLNDTFSDGDALYQALGRLAPNPVAIATTSGLHVTTFRFKALQAQPGQVTIDTIHVGDSHTEVLDVQPPGLNIFSHAGPPAQIQIIQCTNNGHCSDGEFCNGTEICSGNQCGPGSPPNCNDGAFCNGEESCQFGGAGCVSPGNPCPLPATCSESNDDCGGCKAPTVVAEGSRYMAITPAPGTNPVALRFIGDPGKEAVACVEQWLHPSVGAINFPFYQTPAQWGTVHLSACTVLPDTTYRVQTDCQNVMVGLLSNTKTQKTWKWGDVNGNGTVTFTDIAAVIDASNGNYDGSATPESCDLQFCNPDRVVNMIDVSAVQSAVSGHPFPCPDPCNDGEPTRFCRQAIPAVSTWGAVVLGLLLFASGTVVLRRVNCRA